MTADDRASRVYWVLIVTPLAVLALFYLYPLSKVLYLSVTVPRPGLDNFVKLYDSTAIQRILMTTARICVITTAIALVLGYMVAYTALHVRRGYETWILATVLLCFWLSVLI